MFKATARPLVGVFDLVTSMGGVQKVMADLLPRLGERGFRIAVLDPYQHPQYARQFSPATVEVVSFDGVPGRRFIGGTGRIERTLRLAERAPWLLQTGLALRRWVLERRPAVIYFNQLPALGFFSRFLPVPGPRVVYHAHGFGTAADLRRHRIDGTCALVLAVSHAVAGLLAEAGVSRSRMAVVHNGVDPASIRERALARAVGLPARVPGGVVIVLVGVLQPAKQQQLAIEALARLPAEVSLWLCGGVPEGGDARYAERLRRRAAELGVEARVSFLGWRQDVPSVLAAADVAVLPSREESFGIALAEAMALGKPCVGTAVGGIPEVIEHGVTGFICPSDPGALAAALGKLALSPDARLRMGAAGRERVERLFTVGVQACRVETALRELLDGERSRAEGAGTLGPGPGALEVRG